MEIKEWMRPESLEAAYELYQAGGVIVGGGAYMKLGKKSIDKALDLSQLGLDTIEETEKGIELGAMVTLRELERSPILKEHFGDVFSKLLSSISGVQLRNTATIGGTVWGSYGFSDILTLLLAMDAQVELYREGWISLEAFLSKDKKSGLLIKVLLPKSSDKASALCYKKSQTDFSVINVAAARVDGKLRIAVGARPAGASLALEAMKELNEVHHEDWDIEKAADTAAGALSFGSDARASAEYRKMLCKTLVKRCLEEVLG